MTEPKDLRDTASELTSTARQIRKDATPSYPTASLDAGLLEKAAKQLSDAATEIERLKGK